MAGVYISYPFCAQKCSYCNFASGVLPAELESSYLTALETEIRAHDWQWRPDTVYVGGGTPSRLDAPALARILSAVPGRPWKEATIEAAPGGITTALAIGWRGAGITRVSLGVQSFIDAELRIAGRRHTAEVVAAEIESLRAAGFEEINIDLIAGLPKQTFASWKQSLDWIERLAPPHVSVYMLEVDEDSRLGLEILRDGSRYGAASRPSDDQTVEMYEYAVDRLAALGVHRYEISNFARPGHASQHNLKYWRLEPYSGFGVDAHSFDGKLRSQNTDDVRDYAARMQRGDSPCIDRVEARREQERFFVGLRLMDGVFATSGETRPFDAAIRRFVDAGLLERSGEALRLTRQGVLVSNEIFQEFVSA